MNRLPWKPSRWLGLAVFSLTLGCAASRGAADAPAPAPAAAASVPGASRPVKMVHAWRDFLSYWNSLPAAEKSAASRDEKAVEPYLSGGEGYVREYFAARGGGKESIALGDFLALPAPLFSTVEAALSDPANQSALEQGAQDLARRLARVGSPTDTLVIVFLVGDYANYYTTWVDGKRQVVAVQLETFVPLPTVLPTESRESLNTSVQTRPDTLGTLSDVMPWAAYAAARQFTPELRERIATESASLAEYVLFYGFASRFAAAMYPSSVFGRGVGALRAAPAQVLDRVWLDVGASWFPLGTRPYTAARYESVMTSKLPPETTIDQAMTMVGARLAAEWLAGTRIRREADEASEISRLGRVPTLSAWGLLKQ
jgi:hypothetical protein